MSENHQLRSNLLSLTKTLNDFSKRFNVVKMSIFTSHSYPWYGTILEKEFKGNFRFALEETIKVIKHEHVFHCKDHTENREVEKQRDCLGFNINCVVDDNYVGLNYYNNSWYYNSSYNEICEKDITVGIEHKIIDSNIVEIYEVINDQERVYTGSFTFSNE